MELPGFVERNSFHATHRKAVTLWMRELVDEIIE
jgi:hypothetical protein